MLVQGLELGPVRAAFCVRQRCVGLGWAASPESWKTPGGANASLSQPECFEESVSLWKREFAIEVVLVLSLRVFFLVRASWRNAWHTPLTTRFVLISGTSFYTRGSHRIRIGGDRRMRV